GILRPRERVRDRGDGLELAAARGHELLRFARARASGQKLGALAETHQEQQYGHEREQARRERDPKVAADRAPVVQDDRTEAGKRNPDAREDQRERGVREAEARAFAPELRRQRRGDHEVPGREHEQRHGVEENDLAFRTHWALEMIGAERRAVEAPEPLSAAAASLPVSKDRPVGLFTTTRRPR